MPERKSVERVSVVVMNDPKTIAVGMMILADLYSSDEDVQANTIASVLMGKRDTELEAAFRFTHGEAGKDMVEQLKEQYRNVLQQAINQETTRLEQERQQEACEKFMGNHEASPLGTIAELAEEFNMSKKQIRRLKSQGRLEEFVNERRAS